MVLHIGPVLVHVFLAKLWMNVSNKREVHCKTPFQRLLHVMGTAPSLVEGSHV